MTNRQMYITVAVVCIAGFLIILSVLFADADTGEIIVYDDDGNVEHVEEFEYDPMEDSFPAPTINNRTLKKPEPEREVKPKKDTTAPAPPTGTHIIKKEDWNERNKNGRLKLRPGWKKLPYKDMTKRERAVWRRLSKHRGRTRSITGARSYRVGQSQVTEIERLESDKKGRKFKTKETIYDNRFKARTVREQKKASENAPQPRRTFEEELIQ